MTDTEVSNKSKEFQELARKSGIKPAHLDDAVQECWIAHLSKNNVEEHLKNWAQTERKYSKAHRLNGV
jgi:hypothetical protein